MFITETSELEKYYQQHRIWQGVPGIEVTPKGRIFATFYSGGIKEEIGNFVLLIMSEDGEEYSEPIAAAYKENGRCFDPCLWIDPLGRLWFTWSIMPDHGTYAVICEEPDADELVWSEEFFVGHDVMMNKPIVLSTGEWLFPIAVWNDGVRVLGPEYDSTEKDKRPFVYRTIDHGKTFEKIGGVNIAKRSFDEHMVLELADGSLAMYIRTTYGIGVAYSYDGGVNWTEGEDSGIPNPSSRFYIGRLPSGRILLVNHDNAKERDHLTAYLSEDEGKTWKYSLLLDERYETSYPDAKMGPDGYLYIIYDRDRGVFLKSMEEAYNNAREILLAKITEEDIMAGKLVSPKSKLKAIISKLGRYSEENENPYLEVEKFTDLEFADYLLEHYPNNILEKIMEYYSVNCSSMRQRECLDFDAKAEAIERGTSNKRRMITELISLARSVTDCKPSNVPIVDIVKKILQENQDADLSLDDIAYKAGISKYYMAHQFKKATGTTVLAYKMALKITQAKRLLVHSMKSVTEIAQECGFADASHFSKAFVQREGVLPAEYRRILGGKEQKDDFNG